MSRRISSFFCAVTLLMALVPAGVMAARNPARVRQGAKPGKQNRQELKRLKAEQKTLRSQVNAAKANGTLSKEDRARFKAEQKKLRDEINGLKQSQNGN